MTRGRRNVRLMIKYPIIRAKEPRKATAAFGLSCASEYEKFSPAQRRVLIRNRHSQPLWALTTQAVQKSDMQEGVLAPLE